MLPPCVYTYFLRPSLAIILPSPIQNGVLNQVHYTVMTSVSPFKISLGEGGGVHVFFVLSLLD